MTSFVAASRMRTWREVEKKKKEWERGKGQVSRSAVSLVAFNHDMPWSGAPRAAWVIVRRRKKGGTPRRARAPNTHRRALLFFFVRSPL